MAGIVLTAEQDREAELLEEKIRLAIDKEVAAMARLLVSRQDKDLFGKTEFELRDLVLKIGANALVKTTASLLLHSAGSSPACRWGSGWC
jgi:hypothetical protein